MKRALSTICSRFCSTRAVAALEFAVILPVMMLLVYGGYEGWRMVLAGQRIDRVAYSISDLSSRLTAGTTEQDITNLLEGGAFIAEPFDLKSQGRIILSAVDASGTRPILWQRCIGGQNHLSKIGTELADADMTTIRKSPSSTDSTLFVTEVMMKYQAPVVGIITGPVKLTRMAVVPGRVSNPSVIAAGGPPSTC